MRKQFFVQIGIILSLLLTFLKLASAESEPQDKGAFWKKPKPSYEANQSQSGEVLLGSYQMEEVADEDLGDRCNNTALTLYNQVVTKSRQYLASKCNRINIKVDVYEAHTASSSSFREFYGHLDFYCEERDLLSQNAYTMFLACQQNMKPECLQQPYLNTINQWRTTEYVDPRPIINDACGKL